MTGAGPAGHVMWHVMDHESTWLGPVTGNYTDAEQVLLDATKEMDQ